MAVLKKGSFSLNLGIVKLGADLSDDDRQCAWELYTELSTRVAVTGKPGDADCTDFSGELYIESLSSLYKFFQEARAIMREFPVGKIDGDNKDHLGVLINRMMEDVLRRMALTLANRLKFQGDRSAGMVYGGIAESTPIPEPTCHAS